MGSAGTHLAAEAVVHEQVERSAREPSTPLIAEAVAKTPLHPDAERIIEDVFKGVPEERREETAASALRLFEGLNQLGATSIDTEAFRTKVQEVLGKLKP